MARVEKVRARDVLNGLRGETLRRRESKLQHIGEDAVFDGIEADNLHVALFDHRCCGGEEKMLALGEAFVDSYSHVFYCLFLAFKPLSRKKPKISETIKKARVRRIVQMFTNRSQVEFRDDDVITLTNTILRDGRFLYRNIEPWPAELRELLQKPLDKMLTAIQDSYHYNGKASQGRCFGQALQSNKRVVFLLCLIGYTREDTVQLRQQLAWLATSSELDGSGICLATASVSAQDSSHLSVGTAAASSEVENVEYLLTDAWQNEGYYDCIISMGRTSRSPPLLSATPRLTTVPGACYALLL